MDGLRETTSYIHGIIKREARILGGTENIVLGGLSQGCAASMVASLLWDGDALGALVGMCGWLPLSRHLGDIMRGVSIDDEEIDGEEFNPFAEDEDDDGDGDSDEVVDEPRSNVERALAYLREELDMSHDLPAELPLPRTPIFLGHGVLDKKVPVTLGEEMAACLDSMGAGLVWTRYDSLGHWYSPDMLRDIVGFVRKHVCTE